VLAQAAPARTRAHCLSPNVARSATRVQTPTRSAPVLRRAAGLRRPRTAAALTAEPVRLRKRRSRRMRGLHSMLQHSATCCNMLQRSATCVRCTSDGPGAAGCAACAVRSTWQGQGAPPLAHRRSVSAAVSDYRSGGRRLGVRETGPTRLVEPVDELGAHCGCDCGDARRQRPRLRSFEHEALRHTIAISRSRLVQHVAPQHNSLQHSTPRRNTAQPVATQHTGLQRSTPGCNVATHNRRVDAPIRTAAAQRRRWPAHQVDGEDGAIQMRQQQERALPLAERQVHLQCDAPPR
jgi:hypothetical protein